jgi:hypothetical protein
VKLAKACAPGCYQRSALTGMGTDKLPLNPYKGPCPKLSGSWHFSECQTVSTTPSGSHGFRCSVGQASDGATSAQYGVGTPVIFAARCGNNGCTLSTSGMIEKWLDFPISLLMLGSICCREARICAG